MYLFLFFTVYFLLVFVLRSLLLWKKTGINPLTFNKTDDAHGFNGAVFTIISIVELLVIGIYAFKEAWYTYLLPFWYMEHSMLRSIGWGLLLVSLVTVWFAQTQMANSWRIGIDQANKTELVTVGLFSISRNPIFLGIILANIGLFLIIPNAFTLLTLSLSTVSINTQIRLEEEFLLKEFGDNYSAYSTKVKRWF